MNISVYTLAALPLLLLTSCEKELDIDYHDIDPLTVIEATLTPDGARVGITMTTPMDEPMNTSRLTDASVSLHDRTDGITYTLAPDDEGFFTDPAPGIAGHVYTLTVERGDTRYEATTAMLPPTEITSMEFNWIKMPYDRVAVLQVQYRDDPAEPGQCYWVKLYRNGEIYKWSEMDDRSAVGGTATFFTMTTRHDTDEEDDNTVLYDGDVMTCTVAPISQSMHDYLEALQNDSNGPQMFTGDKCLGYFIASSPVSASLTFRPDRIPEFH